MTISRNSITQVAESTPFDKDNVPGCDFTSEDVQSVIEELCARVTTSASPGFSFGRSGNLSANTWLQCETVVSNRAGRWVYISDAVISDVYVGNEEIDTFDIAIYHHEGGEINLTFVGRVTITAARGGKFSVNFTVPTDKQIAVRIENGSSKNTVVGLSLRGTYV